MANFLPKPWTNTPWQERFWTCCFYSLERVFFVLEYSKTFSSPILPKLKRWPVVDETHGPSPFGKFWLFVLFWKVTLFGPKSILLYPEYPKTMLSGLICPINTHGKNFDFLTKTMDWTLWKISLFWKFLKSHFSGLERIHFYPEYKKNIFSGLSCPQNTDGEKFNFFDKNHGGTPLEDFDFLEFFETLLFWYKKHSFLSRISENDVFWLYLPEITLC